MSYDRADYHCGSENYPADLPPENGGIHIGIYLAWCIRRGLEGPFHREDSVDGLADVRAGRMTGRGFLEKYCDEKFWAEDLNEEGQAFTTAYYLSGRYLRDYDEALAGGLPSLYHVEDSPANAERMAERIDRRFAEWKAGRLGKA